MLTKPQKTALEALLRASWVASWWGGKPHGRWPTYMSSRTFEKLLELRFVRIEHGGRFDRIVTVTEAGRAALKETK